MARYDGTHKQATRQRILDSAGRLFKEVGVDGAGIAAVMGGAGLTNGAFYAHFASKEDLVAAVVGEQMGRQVAMIRALAPGGAGAAEFISHYLSPRHRDDPATGCPSAALIDDVARSGEAARRAYTEGAGAIVDEIAVRLDPQDPGAARPRALGLYGLLIGTLQLARSLADEELSDEVLASGIVNATALIG